MTTLDQYNFITEPHKATVMPWDSTLFEPAEKTRLARGLHHYSYVIRQALHLVPHVILGKEVEDPTDAGYQELVKMLGQNAHIALLQSEDYTPPNNAERALVSINSADIYVAQAAAGLSELPFDNFAYSATKALMIAESQTPGYDERIAEKSMKEAQEAAEYVAKALEIHSEQ